MSTEEEASNLIVNQQQVNSKLHSEVELQNVHSDSEAERPNMETRIEPRLSKYVRRHHPTKQIIGNRDARPMTRNRLRSESCLLS